GRVDRLCRDAGDASDNAVLRWLQWAHAVRDFAARESFRRRAREDATSGRRVHARARGCGRTGGTLPRMTAMTKVALSGASGNMGRILRTELKKRGVDLRSAGGRNPLVPLHEGDDIMHGDLRDPAVVDRLLNGVDVLIHRAGTSGERPLQEIIENNLVGLYYAFEGSRRYMVRCVSFASAY